VSSILQQHRQPAAVAQRIFMTHDTEHMHVHHMACTQGLICCCPSTGCAYHQLPSSRPLRQPHRQLPSVSPPPSASACARCCCAPEHKLAASLACIQPVEQSCAGTTHMQIASGGGCKADLDLQGGGGGYMVMCCSCVHLCATVPALSSSTGSCSCTTLLHESAPKHTALQVPAKGDCPAQESNSCVLQKGDLCT
jgi:hypothetical protein